MLSQNSYKALMSVVPSERSDLCDPVEFIEELILAYPP